MMSDDVHFDNLVQYNSMKAKISLKTKLTQKVFDINELVVVKVQFGSYCLHH